MLVVAIGVWLVAIGVWLVAIDGGLVAIGGWLAVSRGLFSVVFFAGGEQQREAGEDQERDAEPDQPIEPRLEDFPAGVPACATWGDEGAAVGGGGVDDVEPTDMHAVVGGGVALDLVANAGLAVVETREELEATRVAGLWEFEGDDHVEFAGLLGQGHVGDDSAGVRGARLHVDEGEDRIGLPLCGVEGQKQVGVGLAAELLMQLDAAELDAVFELHDLIGGAPEDDGEAEKKSDGGEFHGRSR
ncbi:MAG: hypothetical protein CO108_12285 [Deltaproteobacteria bacterium CG_4_9_14_3_um_filter_63_12]|nr:MAG: hypothetical protein CO108_12285 [Deltaproteobacteria bacterium CG_4_9_14_3_um_filter_63_12]